LTDLGVIGVGRDPQVLADGRALTAVRVGHDDPSHAPAVANQARRQGARHVSRADKADREFLHQAPVCQPESVRARCDARNRGQAPGLRATAGLLKKAFEFSTFARALGLG
jgi:hypothetical protein